MVEKKIIDLQNERLEFLIDLNKLRQENDTYLREKKLEAAREAELAIMQDKIREIRKRGTSKTVKDNLKNTFSSTKTNGDQAEANPEILLSSENKKSKISGESTIKRLSGDID